MHASESTASLCVCSEAGICVIKHMHVCVHASMAVCVLGSRPQADRGTDSLSLYLVLFHTSAC